MTARLTWRREPYEPNRSGWGYERGWELWYNRNRIAVVAARYCWGTNDPEGWYWSSGNQALGVPLRNTVSKPVPTADEAKATCLAYVGGCLKEEV